MAFDGIVIANLAAELSTCLCGGRINKIAQPEKDELLLTIKSEGGPVKLLLSASASLPLVYLTARNKVSPMTAPNFCMLLRKHLNSARILSVTQPDFERVLQFEIEHLNELGDVCTKYLMVEIMGKHSNIIFCDQDFTIIDSIKHISGLVSSVREVLPGRKYFIPKTQDKKNPLTITQDEFYEKIYSCPATLTKAIYTSLTGVSPLIANELCHLASLDGADAATSLSDAAKLHLYHTFLRFMEEIKEKHFTPNIVFEDNVPIEFSSVPLSCYETKTSKEYPQISMVLEEYYAAREAATRIRQKSSDLRRIVSTSVERASKKYDLQLSQLKDTEKREKYKIYGELCTTYGYQAKPGAKELVCENYYTNEMITIPLDDTMSAIDNAKKFFDRYQKLKRTYDALTVQIEETKNELMHLESVSSSLDIARTEADLAEVKKELVECGYIKKHTLKEKKSERKNNGKPLHYISSDGYHIYVGKNNFQNEELTFKFATGNDWWFHAKGMAGSHVILKTDGKEELPDRVFEEAGMLAGYYSKGRELDKVEIDYIQKKHIKKPNAGKPGFVIYHTNYSLIITPDISKLKEITD